MHGHGEHLQSETRYKNSERKEKNLNREREINRERDQERKGATERDRGREEGGQPGMTSLSRRRPHIYRERVCVRGG